MKRYLPLILMLATSFLLSTNTGAATLKVPIQMEYIGSGKSKSSTHTFKAKKSAQKRKGWIRRFFNKFRFKQQIHQDPQNDFVENGGIGKLAVVLWGVDVGINFLAVAAFGVSISNPFLWAFFIPVYLAAVILAIIGLQKGGKNKLPAKWALILTLGWALVFLYGYLILYPNFD